ncbi:toxin glutamine deamidase domain-containing protein [Streptomyces sp. SCSIO 30461]|uniref:toxin glutamine deamidase domain-containing protein n=1 Tax=Streptomyces sp. SCSIO 30461 TaxID=3118085 RepID=UPI0030D42FF9
MMLPDELVWVLQMLGYTWPKADEDKLRESAAVWRKFGDDVTALHSTANTSARTVTAHNAGESIDAFVRAYEKFDGGGGDGYLANAAEAAYIIANVMESCAYLVEFAKWAVIAQLIALAIEIFAAQVAAPFTFGLSELGALGATQITRMIVRRLLDELKEALLQAIVEAMKEPAVSALEEMIKDLVRQSVNVGFGAQEGYDLAQTAKAGASGGWEAIKQTPQTLAEGVRDHLGAKAGGRARHAIDSRLDGYDGPSGTGATGGDSTGSSARTSGSTNGGGGSASSDASGSSSDGSSSGSSSGSSLDSSSAVTSSRPTGESPGSSSSVPTSGGPAAGHSDTSGPASTTSAHAGDTPGVNVGGGISADVGGRDVGAADTGAGPDSSAGSRVDSDSGSAQNSSAQDTQAPRHAPSQAGPTLSDFDDPAAGGTPPASGTPGPSHSGSPVSGLSSPSPQSTPAPAQAPSGATSSSPEGGGLGTRIDSLASGSPASTQTNAAPTPTTTDPSTAGTGSRAEGGPTTPSSPTTPSTTPGVAGTHQAGGAPGGHSPATSPSGTTTSPGAARNPSTGAPPPVAPSPRATGPTSTPNPTTPTTPRNAPTPSTDGRPTGTPDPRIPTQRIPGNTIPGDATTPRSTPGTPAGDRTPPHNSPGTSPPGATTPNRNPAQSAPSRATSPSPSTGTPATTPPPSSGSGPDRTPTSSSSTPNSGTPNKTPAPGSRTANPANQAPAQGTPGTPGPTPHQQGPAATPSRPPQQPASGTPGTPQTPNAPQQPAAQSPKPENTPPHQTQQRQPVTVVPIHTVATTPGSSTPPSDTGLPTTPQPPGSPQTDDPSADNQSQQPKQDGLDDIRSDLDHAPGGLTQPDPADQQALDDSVPRNEDGTPQRFPDPHGSWAQLQNDGGNEVPGRSNNCADCSRSFLETWYGNPQVSAPRTLDPDENGNHDPFTPENNANDNQIRWTGAAHTYAGPGGDPDTADTIASTLRQAGPGSAAIVQVDWPGGGGHAFNVVNHDGKIVWIDTQSGEVSDQPLHIDQAEHVWHIPLDANRNPIDATQDADNKESEQAQLGAEAQQAGTTDTQQEANNSTNGPDSHQPHQADPSSGTPAPPPDGGPTHSAPANAARPVDSITRGHSGESTPEAEARPSDEPATGGSSTATREPAPDPTGGASGNESESNQHRQPGREDSSSPNGFTRTNEVNSLDSHGTTSAPEQQAPAPSDRPDASARPGSETPTSERPTSQQPAHPRASGPPTSPPRAAEARTKEHTRLTPQAPTPPVNRPRTDSPAPPDTRTPSAPTGQGNASLPSGPDWGDPTRMDRNASLPEPEPRNAEQLGLAPDSMQQTVRDHENVDPDARGLPVYRIDLDPVHDSLRSWAQDGRLASVLQHASDRMSALQAAHEAGETDLPPTTLSRKFLEDTLGDDFRQMNDGQRSAVVASLARLSLTYHESQGVGHSPEHDRDGRPYHDAAPRRDGNPDRATDAERAVSADARDRASSNFPSKYRRHPEAKSALRKLHEILTGHSKAPTNDQINALIEASGHKPDFSGKNYAVIEVVDADGNSSYVVDSSVPTDATGVSPRHSEKHLLDWLDRTNSGPEGVKHSLAGLYTEREPCGVGEGHADCSTRLRIHPDMKSGRNPVYYSTTYRTDPDGVQQRQEKREKLKELQKEAIDAMDEGISEKEKEENLKKLRLHNEQISRQVGKITTAEEREMTREMDDHLSVLGEVWAKTMLHIVTPQ